jgi:hypothetical protein
MGSVPRRPRLRGLGGADRVGAYCFASLSTKAASPTRGTLAMVSWPFVPGIDFDEALRDLRWFIRGIPV